MWLTESHACNKYFNVLSPNFLVSSHTLDISGFVVLFIVDPKKTKKNIGLGIRTGGQMALR